MESIDGAIMRPAHQSAGSPRARVELRLLEMMSDLAARKANPITASELGRDVTSARDFITKMGTDGLAKKISDPGSPAEFLAARQLIDRIGRQNIQRMADELESGFQSSGLPTSMKNTLLNALLTWRLRSAAPVN
ncbi:MAG: hypothetical protein NDI61_12130 [Bdellovibrionaceae bacterium]|nr:hypothetical protein [Pseudobdellovibrionaceae bacterium]